MNESPPFIVLIGLRGSGKSTLGAAIATRTGRRFHDLDDATSAALGCTSVREAWEKHGEAAFRDAESRALAKALGAGPAGDGEAGVVLALGGGTPTAPGAAELLSRSSMEGGAAIAYLRATPASLRARLSVDKGASLVNRPSLTGGDPLAEIEEIYARRDPLYMRLATSVIDAEGSSDEVMDRVLRAVGISA